MGTTLSSKMGSNVRTTKALMCSTRESNPYAEAAGFKSAAYAIPPDERPRGWWESVSPKRGKPLVAEAACHLIP